MTTGRINQVTESCVLPLGRSHAALLSFNAGPLCSPVHNIAPQIQELPALAPNIRPCPPNDKATTLHPSTQHRTPDARVAGSCTQRTTLPTKLQSVHPAPSTQNRTQIQELPALAPNIRPCPPNYRVSQHCPRGEPRPRYEIATPIAQQRDSDKEQVLRVCKSMTWICGRVSTKSCERNCTAALLESKCTMDPTQHAKTCCLSPSQRGRGPPGPFPGITSCRTRLRTCQSTTTNPTTPSTRKGYAQPTHLDLL